METMQRPKTTDLLITSASLMASWSESRSPCRSVPLKLSALNLHLMDFLVLLVVVIFIMFMPTQGLHRDEIDDDEFGGDSIGGDSIW